MSRAISALLKAALLVRETDQDAVALLTISGTGWTTRRYAVGYQDIVSRGNTFLQLAAEVVLPDDLEDELPEVQLRLDNILRDLEADIRTNSAGATVLLEVVSHQAGEGDLQYDELEASFTLSIKEAVRTAVDCILTVAFEDSLDEPIPGDLMSPPNFPALF